MPDEVKPTYEEAREIVAKSPRGAAALLRLAVQKLCVQLGEKGKNLNDDIGSLVKRGLPERVQQAFDLVRVTGGRMVHPGLINDEDTPEAASSLFGLLNFVCEVMIAQPEKVQSLYQKLPATKPDQIERRDGKQKEPE